MVRPNHYLPIITLNVKDLNSPIKDKDWLAGLKIRPIYLLSTRNTSHQQIYMQTERERMEKDISC